MHGGAPGSGGPKGPHNGTYKHGRYTAEANRLSEMAERNSFGGVPVSYCPNFELGQ
jgi:hypothetical protein